MWIKFRDFSVRENWFMQNAFLKSFVDRSSGAELFKLYPSEYYQGPCLRKLNLSKLVIH